MLCACGSHDTCGARFSGGIVPREASDCESRVVQSDRRPCADGFGRLWRTASRGGGEIRARDPRICLRGRRGECSSTLRDAVERNPWSLRGSSGQQRAAEDLGVILHRGVHYGRPPFVVLHIQLPSRLRLTSACAPSPPVAAWIG